MVYLAKVKDLGLEKMMSNVVVQVRMEIIE
jgi:hypothetical protein